MNLRKWFPLVVLINWLVFDFPQIPFALNLATLTQFWSPKLTSVKFVQCEFGFSLLKGETPFFSFLKGRRFKG